MRVLADTRLAGREALIRICQLGLARRCNADP
jgi:hypothetical protein